MPQSGTKKTTNANGKIKPLKNQSTPFSRDCANGKLCPTVTEFRARARTDSFDEVEGQVQEQKKLLKKDETGEKDGPSPQPSTNSTLSKSDRWIFFVTGILFTLFTFFGCCHLGYIRISTGTTTDQTESNKTVQTKSEFQAVIGGTGPESRISTTSQLNAAPFHSIPFQELEVSDSGLVPDSSDAIAASVMDL